MLHLQLGLHGNKLQLIEPNHTLIMEHLLASLDSCWPLASGYRMAHLEFSVKFPLVGRAYPMEFQYLLSLAAYRSMEAGSCIVNAVVDDRSTYSSNAQFAHNAFELIHLSDLFRIVGPSFLLSTLVQVSLRIRENVSE